MYSVGRVAVELSPTTKPSGGLVKMVKIKSAFIIDIDRSSCRARRGLSPNGFGLEAPIKEAERIGSNAIFVDNPKLAESVEVVQPTIRGRSSTQRLTDNTN